MLRPYQIKALNDIRGLYAQGVRRVLLQMPTGSGKTTVFSEVLNGVKSRGKKAIVVVFGVDLIENASQRLHREGIPHGVLQGNHWNYRPREAIQVCSITTLHRRKLTPDADLVVFDEAHQTNNTSYKWLIDQYPNAFFLPVTATPHLKKGMRHIADEVVYPITFKDLVAQGFLVPPRYFVPVQLDLSGVRIDAKTGDYSISDLSNKMDGPKIYGEVVTHYKSICNNQPAICFAINVKHSLMIRDMFLSEGIAADHIDADTPASERATAYKKLETGELKVLVNVGVATTGVDIPCLRAVILCRPTKSYNLMIQMCGRGTRPYSDKDFFTILDHANNVLEHGFIEDEQICNLDGWKKDSAKRAKICESCFFAWSPEKPREPCPECGFVNAAQEKSSKKSNLEVAEAKLVEIKSVEDLHHMKLKKFVDKQIDKANQRGYKPGFVFHKIKEKYTETDAKKFWPYIKAKVELYQDPR